MADTQLSEVELMLLKSLKDGSKIVHLGQSPVAAIAAAWKFEAMGLVTTIASGNSCWEIALTTKGFQEVSQQCKQ